MPHFLLSAETAFAAAHTLPGVPTCERLHGHNWRVRLTVSMDESELDQGGMGMDFRTIEEALRSAVAEFDHSYLNDLEPFRERAPTAERLAQVIHTRAASRVAEHSPTARVVEVELWEMPQYRVSYRPA
jgi:6-pyruvoyltetrahydropterin/6-carboxytetrahydropterin synthase